MKQEPQHSNGHKVNSELLMSACLMAYTFGNLKFMQITSLSLSLALICALAVHTFDNRKGETAHMACLAV